MTYLRTLRACGRMLLGSALVASLALTLQPARVHAQQGAVTGRVVDAESGSPLSGARVLVRGTDAGALTGENGRFLVLGVPAGAHVVEASALGYRTVTQTSNVSGGSTVQVDFSLEARPIELGGIQVSILRPDLRRQAVLTGREVREANPKDAGQLLRNLDGVDAVRRGALGLDPVVRGLRETEVGTYLDGTRLFPAGPGRMDSPLTHLDPSAVQEIEVVKGPYALTWGAGNLSAIRVETPPLPARGTAAFAGSLSAGHDSNLRASELSGSVSGRSGGFSYWAHGVGREGHDYRAGGSSAEVIPADFSAGEGRAKVGLDVGESSMLTLSGGYQDEGKIDYPGRLMTALYFHASNVSGEWETRRTQGFLRALEVAAYRNKVDHMMDNSGKPSAAMNHVEVDAGIEVWGGRAAADLETGPWAIRVGGDVYTADRQADRRIESLAGPTAGNVMNLVIWPDATITDVGLFSQVSRSLAGVRLSGTLRLDQVWADAARPSASFLDFLSRVDGSQNLGADETNLSAALTAGFDLDPNWSLSLGVGSAVRTADASERYSDHQPSTKSQFTAEFMGNPALHPERSTQGDVWLEGTYSRATFGLNVFGRQVSDYVTLALTSEPRRQQMPIFPTTVYRYVNGDARFFGGEASMLYGLADFLTADVGVSYLWGEETAFPTTDGSMKVEEPAIGVQPATGRLGLRYEELGGRYFLEGTAKLVARQTRVAETRGELETDGYSVFDVRAGFAPVRGISLALGIENLFNKLYVSHLNSKNPFTGLAIPEPGRVFYIDVSYAF